jgi:DNA polymerase-3 subunit chi
MISISFYQLMLSPIEKVLPRLLEKIYASGQKVVIMCGSDEHMKKLNTALWTYTPLSFLPHGCALDHGIQKELQPIWLTTTLENPNNSGVCVSVHEKCLHDLEYFGFQRLLDVYDHTLTDSKDLFYDRFLFYAERYNTPTAWQQTKEGWKPSVDLPSVL